MASKRNIRRKQCGSKIKHSKEGAFAVKYKMKKSGKLIRAYLCKFCKSWHTGRNKSSYRKSILDLLS